MVQENLIDKDLLEAYHDELMKKVVGPIMSLGTPVEGYMRVAGSSDPALSYRAIEGYDMGKSWKSIFYPCLVGTKLSGNDAQVGKILYVLDKLGARIDNGTAKWLDIEGNLHAIDGSEGDVMVVNTKSYYELSGRYTIDNVEYDIFLRSLSPFVFNSYEATEIKPFGWSPDYCVAHADSGADRMHSVYNPSWAGSYSAPYGVAGRYAVTEQNGEIVETYDSSLTMLGGSGGLHSTDISLYDGEQRAMNNNVDTTKTYPWFNATARGAELLWGNLAAEGGTFDSHKAALFGSGFCSNDAANASTYEASGSEARNGLRVTDKDGAWKYYSFGNNVRFLTGLTSGTQYGAYVINSWRNPWHCMEAYRAVCYAIEQGIAELEWFAFEGCKYKWRSVNGFAGPAKGEATCVVFKMMSTQAGASAVDPTDGATSIAGNRVDVVVSTGLYHGITTQVSPSWWTSGLIFTGDENRQYEAYMQRDQTKLIKSFAGDFDTSEALSFETAYNHVGTFTYGDGYRKNYSNDAFMLPDTNANKSGAGLHTYVGAYNWFTGGAAAAAGKKGVRGYRRGIYAFYDHLSPLTMGAGNAPSHTNAYIGFGTCVAIVEGA